MFNFGLEFELTDNYHRHVLSSILSCTTRNWRECTWEHTPTDNSDWVLKNDSSCGYELCSPRMSSVNDLKTVITLINRLNMAGVRANSSCGYHVHIDYGNSTQRQVGSTLIHYTASEPLIFSSLPKYRRHNEYCFRVSQQYEEHLRQYPISNYSVWIERFAHTRYSSINIQPWAHGNKRVEFRYPEGTTNSDDVIGHLLFLQHFCERAQRIVPTKKLYDFNDFISFMNWEEPQSDQLVESTRKWWLKRLLKYHTPVKDPEINKTITAMRRRAKDMLENT